MKFDLSVKHDLNEQDLAFLNSWLDWVERGAPDGEPYSRADGLCITMYDFKHNFDVFSFNDLFDDGSPFHPWSEYLTRAARRTQHECPVRLAWVRLQTGRPA